MQSAFYKIFTSITGLAAVGTSSFIALAQSYSIDRHEIVGGSRRGTIALFAAVVAALFAAAPRAAAAQALHGHVPAAIAGLQPKGLMTRTDHLHLAISLPLRDQAGVSNLFAAIYDPASPEFHRNLTPEQFTERFGPTEDDYQALEDFVKANGLTV